MDRKYIQIFYEKRSASSCGNSSGGCCCGCEPSADSITFDDLLKKYFIGLSSG